MKKSILAIIFLVLIGIVFAVTLVINSDTVGVGTAQTRSVKLGADKPPVTLNSDLKMMSDAFMSVAKSATPSVVSIVVTTKARKPSGKNLDEFFKFFPDFKFHMPEEQTQGAGSGVIATADGYIITNNHVIEDAADDGIEVVLNDTRRYQAKLVGTDPLTDVAVVKVDANSLPVAALGNSDNVRVGQWTIAIGNPLGLNSTVTAGIISYIGRNIGIIGDSYGVENFIQTDAAINPGNSGGALVNIAGEVIGINTAIATTNQRYQGYGFAIPINLVKTVAEDLILHGKVDRGYIGVQIGAVDETFAKANGLDKAEGVLVQQVLEGSAAQDAGVKDGDIIFSVDKKSVNAPNELQTLIAGRHPGDKVTLQIWRDGKRMEKVVTLKPRSENSTVASNDEGNTSDEEAMTGEKQPALHFDQLGFSVQKADVKTQKERNVQSEVMVSEVKPYKEAWSRFLREGDIVVEADRLPVTTLSSFDKIVQSKKPGDAIMLRVKQPDGSSVYVAMEIPKE
ncbi:MAG: Do family serine endopeptidase [Bacteroidota bacterium]|nr:Do family serine endopeptidase [Bacteroidota bacterium]